MISGTFLDDSLCFGDPPMDAAGGGGDISLKIRVILAF